MRQYEIPEQHVRNLLLMERSCSAISIAGCLAIIITFATCNTFNKSVNRLICFASAGNLMTNIATLIASDGASSSQLCQAQGFLIQMLVAPLIFNLGADQFMCADALWTLAMACNVYLTFYFKFSAERLKSMEKVYFLLCCGLPAMPATIFLFVKVEGRGPIYGDSLLWCWITSEYDSLRLSLFYGPVWFVIIITGAIYVRAGQEIWHRHVELRRMVMAGIKEVKVKNTHMNPNNHDTMDPYNLDNGIIYQHTEVEVSYDQVRPIVNVNVLGHQLSAADKPHGIARSQFAESLTGAQENVQVQLPVYEYHIGYMPPFPSRVKTKESTAQRHEKTAQAKIKQKMKANPKKQLATYHANKAAWNYTRVSGLFFLAMMFTWVPSSANRVWSAVYDDDVSLPLTYASAFCLPLQGFWNFCIYCLASRHAIKDLFGRAGVPWFKRKLFKKHYGSKHYAIGVDETECLETASWGSTLFEERTRARSGGQSPCDRAAMKYDRHGPKYDTPPRGVSREGRKAGGRKKDRVIRGLSLIPPRPVAPDSPW